jgi:putative transposase
VHELRLKYPVVRLLGVVNLAKSSFYHWDEARQRPDKHDEVKEDIVSVYDRHKGRYGYRRIAGTLQKLGTKIHENTVLKLMRQLGLKSLQRPKKYQSHKGEVGRIAPNVLKRKFWAKRPNEKWVTDITEFKVGDEKLYFSPIKDLFNCEIVTYTFGARPVAELVTTMLKKGLRKLKPGDRPMLHSDQGWQYQMLGYRKAVTDNGLIPSMSRKGNCYDNASMESFFAVLKSECFHLKKFVSIDALKKELETYIRYYNHERIQTGLGGLSPVEYRLKHAKMS